MNTLHLKSLFTLLFVFSFQYVVAQDHPGTGGALCGSCTPTGWSLDAGSPDISSNDAWGFELLPSGAGTAWTNTIPPIPNGEVGFLTAHSTEVASMVISGLTVGVSYTLEFYYMTALVANPQAGYGGILSPNIRYSIDGNPMVVKPIAVAETWYKELVVFTATATTSTFVFHGGSNDGVSPGNSATDGDLTSISFKPNGTVPTVPACPTVTVTTTLSSSICVGESIALTATGPAEPNYTYTWQPGGITGTSISVSPTDTIAYQVTADSAGCNGNANAIVVVKPLPVLTVNSETICAGQSAPLTASGATDYSWLPATDLDVTNVAAVNSTPASDITYTVTGTADGCSSTAESSVTIAPGLTITVNSETICDGESVTLTASGADTYSWMPGSIAGNPLINTPIGTTTYTVTGSANGCTGTAESIVTIGAGVSPDAGADITICTGAAGTIGAASVAGYSYSWTPTLNLSSSTTANPSVTLTNTGATASTTTFSLTAGPAGCEGTAEVIVTVDPIDDASFSYSSGTVCKTGGTNPTPTITGISGGTYSGSAGLSINATTGEIDLTATAIGNYTVTYTTPGPCVNAGDFAISVVDVPLADFSYAGPYCQSDANATVTFAPNASGGVFSSTAGLVFVNSASGEVDNAASTPGPYTVTNTITAAGCPSTSAVNTITINAAPVTTVNNETVCDGVPATLTGSGADDYVWSDASILGTLTVSPSASTQYTVTGTTAGCSSSAISTVTVNLAPTVTVDNVTICDGDAGTLTGAGAMTYLWSDASTANTLNVSPLTTTSYTVTGATSGCSADAVGTITVSATPVVTTADAGVCSGLPATLTANSTIPTTTYGWSTAAIGASITVNPSVTTSYTVTGTTTDGCFSSAVSNVTVNLTPTVTASSGAACGGNSVSITAAGATTYLWSDGTVGASLTASPATTTSYTVTGTSSNCSATAIGTVTVNPIPVVTVNSVVICDGNSGTLVASGATTYSWSNGSITNPLSISPSATTSYTVTGSSSGCTADAVGVITIEQAPIILVDQDTICAGETASLTASGGATYAWSSGATTDATTVNPLNTTTYTVTGSGANGCPSTATGEVSVFPTPTANFSFSPDPAGVLAPEITFSDRSSSDVTYWEWDFGDGETLAPSTRSPVHLYPSVETTYTVTLNVSNQGGCTDTISKEVIIGPEFILYVPNAFSPNDDFVNDLFGAKGEGVVEFLLFVFDRWGNLVFTADDINDWWDGTFKSDTDLVQQDVFVWRIALTDVFDKNHEFIGTVSLIK